jgi:3'(2'), 5'-bisphosphate nucleotidase
MQIINSNLLSDLLQLSDLISKKILEVYSRDFNIETKSDNSPVTEADLLVDKIYHENLAVLTPDIPILSEESQIFEYKLRKDLPYLWCIDPIDGTKEFIKKNGEFASHLALIHQNQVLFSMVICPVQGTVYYAQKGCGAYEKSSNGINAIKTVDKQILDKTIAVTSRSHRDQISEKVLKSNFENIEFRPLGSSHKIIALAKGEADIYLKIGGTSEWDIAAPQLILEECGGKILDLDFNQPLKYNKADLYNPNFIAFRKGIEIQPSFFQSIR